MPSIKTNNNDALKKSGNKKRKTLSKYVRAAVRDEFLKTLETKHIFSQIASNGNGTTAEGSRAITLFRIEKGTGYDERNGLSIIPQGVRLDWHIVNKDAVIQELEFTCMVVELRDNRAINAGNASTYVLSNLYQANYSEASFAVGTSTLSPAEKCTQPFFTDLFHIHGIKRVRCGRSDGTGANPASQCGTVYVPLKDKTPIRYSNPTTFAPGDPDCSRNIIALFFAHSTSIEDTFQFTPYSAKLNIRQYYKDN